MKGIYLQYTYLFNPFDYRTLITWIISPCIDLITGPANGFFTVQFQEFFIHKLDMKILIHYIQTVAHAFYNSLQFIPFQLNFSFKEVGKDFPVLLREYQRELLIKECVHGITDYILLSFVDSGNLSCQLQHQHRVLCMVKEIFVLLL